MKDFSIPLKEFEILKDNDYLTFEKIEYWLFKYDDLYFSTVQFYSCSPHEGRLPCMCCKRRPACLFVDIYEVLAKLSELGMKNDNLKEEVSSYYKIENDEVEERNWLLKNLNKKVDTPYGSNNEYLDYNSHVLNGKIDEKYININIKIKGTDFRYAYDFEKIYNNLFYERKILPKEYAEWKKESGFQEFDEFANN